MSDSSKEPSKMDKIVSLCKRRGFVFPSSEIYGGFAAVYDYGPYGAELARNIRDFWWQEMVQNREDVVGLDAAIFMLPKVWVASGHVGGFSDPLVECKNCHTRSRVDHLLEDVDVKADEKMSEEEINKVFIENKAKVKCPSCGKNDFTETKKFNLLVQSNLGNFSGDWTKEPVYLRGETCQGIYVNFKNVLNSSRVSVPFGIAQIGKAFRNEITARQYIFRTREFEQMEMEYFTSPETEMEEYEKLRQLRWNYYLKMGIKEENLKWHKHENLVFYAKEAYDIEYNYPFGFKELEGIHARGDYDLTQHAKFSGEDFTYTDPNDQTVKYVPHIIESSVGVGRTLLAILSDSYTEEVIKEGETRIVLKILPKLAPVKVAIFPLLKNKPELVAKAQSVYDDLKGHFMCEFDDNGNVGKRYRRQDEIGTPWCVTVDFQTLEDDTVTIRDRDSMEQDRVKLSEILCFVNSRL